MSDGGAGSLSSRMATRKPAPPKLDLLILVRHGQTPTTGVKLPGRAKGLHLSDVGRQQADAVAERLSVLPRMPFPSP